MFLSNQDIADLVAWRRKLHENPEISGEESETAREVRSFLAASGPDRVISNLGGHGVAVVYEGSEPGPTVLFRAELDALPIEELGDVPHRSRVTGKGHLCGHDGHTAILAAVGRQLGRERPRRGRVALMFQPAEETGAGAAAVIADPKFAEVAPDYAFSLHNLPGLPLGHVGVKTGVVNCASRGMLIVLDGKTAHASMPETGISPMQAVSRLMPELTALGGGDISSEDFALVTVTHAAMGAPAFGIAPGRAEIWATLRTLVDRRMEKLCERAESLVREAAERDGLVCGISYHDIFRHCENDAEAVRHLRAALDAESIPHDEAGLPMRASEDFGRFGDGARSAMLFLGSGVDHPALHNPDYDFPDDLITVGARIFMRTARNLLG
ncbi:amidohydrolase [Aquamicrobium sp. LC103]|uniref:amidohydrolase n=1 Tax=Aquamicrobium sp. LC103 TaxID=1120658 RepID=UPI00063ECFEE|nr:amidohydrolase [Aquamicrobium sp. LC103]TKT75392.1 amidohydrolase [Aquamicrobium sp. LC103]